MNNINCCDKCGQPVDPKNDAVRLEMIAFQENAASLLFAQSRHFLPDGNCPGSPSRAQYIEGQPKDARYAYNKQYEKVWRDAYAKLLEENS